jgi:hypothetical protein
VGVAHLLGEFDELGDDLGGGQVAVGVLRNGSVEELRELACLDEILASQGTDLVVEEPFQELLLSSSHYVAREDFPTQSVYAVATQERTGRSTTLGHVCNSSQLYGLGRTGSTDQVRS